MYVNKTSCKGLLEECIWIWLLVLEIKYKSITLYQSKNHNFSLTSLNIIWPTFEMTQLQTSYHVHVFRDFEPRLQNFNTTLS